MTRILANILFAAYIRLAWPGKAQNVGLNRHLLASPARRVVRAADRACMSLARRIWPSRVAWRNRRYYARS